MNKSANKNIDVKRIVGISVFAALAYVVSLSTSWIKIGGFLSFDLKDTVIVIASFIYGPVAAVCMSAIAALLEFIIPVTGTGVYGLIMNFSSSVVFSLTASIIYKYKRTLAGAIIGLYTASLLTVGAMMALNLLVTPYYMGVDLATVKGLIPVLLLPFNAAKTLMNSALVMILYKPISQAMCRAGLIKDKVSSFKFNKYSVILLVSFAVTLAAAIVLLVVIN